MIRIRKGSRFSKKELKVGAKIELEHTTNPRKARFIAMQHLTEFPNYYTRGLLPMEKKLTKLNRRKK